MRSGKLERNQCPSLRVPSRANQSKRLSAFCRAKRFLPEGYWNFSADSGFQKFVDLQLSNPSNVSRFPARIDGWEIFYAHCNGCRPLSWATQKAEEIETVTFCARQDRPVQSRHAFFREPKSQVLSEKSGPATLMNLSVWTSFRSFILTITKNVWIILSTTQLIWLINKATREEISLHERAKSAFYSVVPQLNSNIFCPKTKWDAI